MFLIDFFESNYLPLRLRSRSKNTIRLYRHSIALFHTSLMKKPDLEDLTDDNVSRHLSNLTRMEYSVYSVAKERSQLLAIWNYAARKGILNRFPDVPPEVLPKQVPMAWMEEEMHRLIASCRLVEGRIDCIPASSWWVALHMVAWDTAERIGAIRKLEWSNLQGDWLLVPASVRKGKRGDKLFRLARDTMDALNLIRLPPRALIFPWDRSETLIYKHYDKILTRAGLPTDYKSKFHRLRKTAASYFKKAGGDPTDLLGHADARTTAKYIDPRVMGHKFPADVLFRLGED